MRMRKRILNLKQWKFTLVAYGSFMIITILLIVVFHFYKYKTTHLGIGVSGEFDTYQYHYVMISEHMEDTFWDGIYASAKNRGKEVDVYVEQLGVDLTEGYSVKEQLEIAIASNVDGIIIEPNGEKEVAELIDQAMNLQIPVITVMEDEPKSKRISFIGVSSYEQGRSLGRQIEELIALENTNSLQVAVLLHEGKEETNQNMLYGAIIDEMKEDGIEIESFAINGSSNFGATEDIRKIIMENQAPDILVCLTASDTLASYQAVVDYNKVGEVNVIGYFDSELIASAIEKNIVQSTIRIDTSQMGRYCVEALSEYIDSQRVSEFFPVDIQIVKASNVDKYKMTDDMSEELEE